MATKKIPQRSYRELQEELESILSDMQRDDLDIDSALVKYERGMQIINELDVQLKLIGNKVEEVKAKFTPDGA